MNPDARRLSALLAVRALARSPRLAWLPAVIYLRGWLVLHRRDPRRWHAGQLARFLGGLAAIFLALASPIEPFAALLLQVHMLQHLLLMMVAPPLLWLGAPLFPLLRGLPQPIRTYWVAPLLRSPALRRLFRAADASGRGAAAVRRDHLAVALRRRSTNSPCARAAGIIFSTSVSWPRACCSGIPSSGRIPAARAGRPGCCCRT